MRNYEILCIHGLWSLLKDVFRIEAGKGLTNLMLILFRSCGTAWRRFHLVQHPQALVGNIYVNVHIQMHVCMYVCMYVGR